MWAGKTKNHEVEAQRLGWDLVQVELGCKSQAQRSGQNTETHVGGNHILPLRAGIIGRNER